MANEKRDAMTADEVAALKYCAERGLALPDWLTEAGGKYYRPHRLTGDQFMDYASRLRLYDSHASAEALAKIKTWITVLGVLSIIGIVLTILF